MGDGDLAIGGAEASLAWLELTGGFSALREVSHERRQFARNVEMADLDADGDADLFFGFDADGPYYWLEPRTTRAIGDANQNGLFESTDLVLVFQAGKYEDSLVGNSTFHTGDWNGDNEFDSRDLVLAIQAGSYVG